MRDEKLILTVQPKLEFGDLNSNIPTNVMDLPDDWLDGLSDLIHEIFFIENDEEFDSLLRRLEPGPGAISVADTIDPLGIYSPRDKMIKIDQNKIAQCAEYMRTQGAAIDLDQLSKIVKIHEDSHALHHLAGDPLKNNDIWDQFGGNPSYVLEMLAQLFTYHEVLSDSELLEAFYELEKRQPLVYHLWRLFRKCPKDGLYWCIRDSHNCVLRIVKILEKLGCFKSIEIGNHQIWQVASGDTNRNYADLCLAWDVILNGPGSDRPWPDCRDALANCCSSRKLADIKRFSEDIADGDIILLHVGTKKVYGVGVAVGNYQWNEEFGDVDGWELQHIRRVRWIWKYNDIDPKGPPKEFDAYTLNFGDTTQKIDYQIVNDWIKTIPVTDQMLNRKIMTLPKTSQDILINEISEYLFDNGVAAGAIASVTGELDELIRIAEWYQRKGIGPSESETVAYLVIPLFRCLGWTPQKMAVEWNNVDVALFKTLPRTNEKLSVVVEAKPKDFSCLTATPQAQYYAEQNGRENCNRLVVTDGIRYAVYFRIGGGFQKHPDAYLNITRMREAYPILHCAGAKEAFLYMSADWGTN